MSRSRTPRAGVGSRRSRLLRISFAKNKITGRAKTRSASRKSSRQTGIAGRTQFRGHRANLTTNHEEIRAWVEERGGHPATVKSRKRGSDPAGILRIDFPGFSGAQSLKQVSWDEWFKVFDERRLAFLHQDRTATGKTSRFNKLVCRT